MTYSKPEDCDGPIENGEMDESNGASDWQEAYDDDGNVYYYTSAEVPTTTHGIQLINQ